MKLATSLHKESELNLLQGRSDEVGQSQEPNADIPCRLDRHADILLDQFQPVHVQFEGLGVNVELSQRLVNLREG